MERRRSIRIPEDESVQVTSLCEAGNSQPGRSRNSSQGGMCVSVSQPIPVNTPVQIEWGNSVLMGEVSRCDREGGLFLLGLQLNQVLTMTAQLRGLALALQGATGDRVRTTRS
jgi:hypothetical protein